jgi:hypothetical protein
VSTTETAIFVKVETEHADDCKAVESVAAGYWPTPWSGVLDAHHDLAFLRKDARGSGHRLFWRIACNDPDCPARLLVRVSDVLELIAGQGNG